MNETLELLHGHRSDRDFTGEPISDEVLEAVVEAAHRAPSSRNGQHTSLIVIKDVETRRKIVELTKGRQQHIVQSSVFLLVVADLYKTGLGVEHGGGRQVFHETVEGYTVAAVDAGIVLASLSLAARSQGLGAVIVGAVRLDTQPLIDLLRLPPRTYPIAGVCIGRVRQPAQPKPRLPLAAFRHDEYYQAERLPGAIAEYDRMLTEHWQATGRTDGLSWSKSLQPYAQYIYPVTKSVTYRQGFTLEK